MERVSKPTSRLVSRGEHGNFLDNFKTNILSNLSEQTNMLRKKNNKKVENVGLSIFFLPKCRKKHIPRECLIDNIEICFICA